MTKKKTGRPPKINEAVLGKLEQAFALGCTDIEACLYADICPDTLYEYQKKHPEFTDRKRALKENPILKARKAVADTLTDGSEKERAVMARWYLEHKKADEFSTRQEVALQADGVLSIEDRGKALDSFLNRFIDD